MKKHINKYFGIGIYMPKTGENIGTLWRSAWQLGADFIFIIGKKYTRQSSDVYNTFKKIPLLQYKDIPSFLGAVYYDCRLVGIEKYRKKEIESTCPMTHRKYFKVSKFQPRCRCRC